MLSFFSPLKPQDRADSMDASFSTTTTAASSCASSVTDGPKRQHKRRTSIGNGEIDRLAHIAENDNIDAAPKVSLARKLSGGFLNLLGESESKMAVIEAPKLESVTAPPQRRHKRHNSIGNGEFDRLAHITDNNNLDTTPKVSLARKLSSGFLNFLGESESKAVMIEVPKLESVTAPPQREHKRRTSIGNGEFDRLAHVSDNNNLDAAPKVSLARKLSSGFLNLLGESESETAVIKVPKLDSVTTPPQRSHKRRTSIGNGEMDRILHVTETPIATEAAAVPKSDLAQHARKLSDGFLNLLGDISNKDNHNNYDSSFTADGLNTGSFNRGSFSSNADQGVPMAFSRLSQTLSEASIPSGLQTLLNTSASNMNHSGARNPSKHDFSKGFVPRSKHDFTGVEGGTGF